MSTTHKVSTGAYDVVVQVVPNVVDEGNANMVGMMARQLAETKSIQQQLGEVVQLLRAVHGDKKLPGNSVAVIPGKDEEAIPHTNNLSYNTRNQDFTVPERPSTAPLSMITPTPSSAHSTAPQIGNTSFLSMITPTTSAAHSTTLQTGSSAHSRAPLTGNSAHSRAPLTGSSAHSTAPLTGSSAHSTVPLTGSSARNVSAMEREIEALRQDVQQLTSEKATLELRLFAMPADGRPSSAQTQELLEMLANERAAKSVLQKEVDLLTRELENASKWDANEKSAFEQRLAVALADKESAINQRDSALAQVAELQAVIRILRDQQSRSHIPNSSPTPQPSTSLGPIPSTPSPTHASTHALTSTHPHSTTEMSFTQDASERASLSTAIGAVAAATSAPMIMRTDGAQNYTSFECSSPRTPSVIAAVSTPITMNPEPSKTGFTPERIPSTNSLPGELPDDDPEGEEEEGSVSLEQRKFEEERLVKAVGQYMGFFHNKPLAAFVIFRSCIRWRVFKSEPAPVLDHIASTIQEVVHANHSENESMAYWLSNTASLSALITGHVQPISPTTHAFKQQMEEVALHAFKNMVVNVKRQLTPLLSSVARSEAKIGIGAKSVNSQAMLKKWTEIFGVLEELLAMLQGHEVPLEFIQALFKRVFHSINVLLFNQLLLRRECCALSHGEYLSTALSQVRNWIQAIGPHFMPDAWDELKATRQAVNFLVANDKSSKTFEDFCSDLCPALSIQHLFRISTMFYDDKYNMEKVSGQVLLQMKQQMAASKTNYGESFLLDDTDDDDMRLAPPASSLMKINPQEVCCALPIPDKLADKDLNGAFSFLSKPLKFQV